MAETSTKPYLIRALHEWCTDNGYAPHIAVAVDERTLVPREFVRNGEIVLNLSALATHRLQIGNDLVSFQARFGGVAREISIPVENILSIYARETGQGMAFEVARAPEPANMTEPGVMPTTEPPARPQLAPVPTARPDVTPPPLEDPEDPPSAPSGGKPRLKRVK